MDDRHGSSCSPPIYMFALDASRGTIRKIFCFENKKAGAALVYRFGFSGFVMLFYCSTSASSGRSKLYSSAAADSRNGTFLGPERLHKAKGWQLSMDRVPPGGGEYSSLTGGTKVPIIREFR